MGKRAFLNVASISVYQMVLSILLAGLISIQSWTLSANGLLMLMVPTWPMIQEWLCSLFLMSLLMDLDLSQIAIEIM
jgi:hypothetical protein